MKKVVIAVWLRHICLVNNEINYQINLNKIHKQQFIKTNIQEGALILQLPVKLKFIEIWWLHQLNANNARRVLPNSVKINIHENMSLAVVVPFSPFSKVYLRDLNNLSVYNQFPDDGNGAIIFRKQIVEVFNFLTCPWKKKYWCLVINSPVNLSKCLKN